MVCGIYGYVCTSSAEADWRKRDLVLQGFILWIKSMAWPAHLHTQECLVKGLLCSPDGSKVQARQAARTGRSSASRRVCLDLNGLLQVHHPLPALPRASILWSETDIKSEVMHSTLAGQSLNWCTEQFFQKHDILNRSLKARARLLLILALPWNAHLSLSIILSAYLPCLGFLKIQFCTLVLKCEGFHIGIERKINWKKKFTYTSKIA